MKAHPQTQVDGNKEVDIVDRDEINDILFKGYDLPKLSN